MTDPTYDEYLADMERAHWAEQERLHGIELGLAYDEYLAGLHEPRVAADRKVAGFVALAVVLVAGVLLAVTVAVWWPF